jgi:plasmid stabilization system protein ParE
MFRVRWERRALDELTDLWTQADSVLRQAITAASHAVDQRLQADPNGEGESRARGRRITFVPPLAVIFRVEAAGQTVSVLQVRLLRRRGP